MVENFKLGELGGIISYLKKEKGKIVFFNSKSRYVSIDPEALKTWLEEATKLRYEVVQPDKEIWSIVNTNTNWIIASYFKEKGFDAKAEAEKLCERLNKGEGD